MAASDWTRAMGEHRKRVYNENRLLEKTPFPHRGIKPASELLLSFGSDTLPTELFRPSLSSLSGTSWILTPSQPHYESSVED